MNDILNLIKTRRSIRDYLDKPIQKDAIDKILEAGRWAPSGVNMQPWHFIVVKSKELRTQVGNQAKFLFIKSRHVSEAPLIIVLCGNPRSNFYKTDCALAGANMVMEATALGIGSCWIGAFNEAKIKEILDIPEKISIIALITFGYFAENPQPPPKLDLNRIVHREKFGNTKEQGIYDKIVKTGPISVISRVLKIIFRF
ncbi:MAG: nitroreductase family protein [Thermodesulfobacteriota bacterium]|nr:nitroreductase family protein [Thermodesulfobacteriota bacterium]